jgi:hypothetical protein
MSIWPDIIGDDGLGRGVLQALDLGVGPHVPEQIASAGEHGRKYPHRRALGERTHGAGGADARAEIGAA